MITVILEQAENGIIKTIHDSNINGAGEEFESKVVYDFDNNKNFTETIKFFYELTDDLNIDTGNKFENKNLVMDVDWGNSYTPAQHEIKGKIKILESELSYLKEMLKTYDKI